MLWESIYEVQLLASNDSNQHHTNRHTGNYVIRVINKLCLDHKRPVKSWGGVWERDYIATEQSVYKTCFVVVVVVVLFGPCLSV